MSKVMLGAFAGLAATVPMTVAMKLMHRHLPKDEQYPLPPRQITMRMAEKLGVKKKMNGSVREEASCIAHFSYGAACGAVYAPLADKVLLPPALAGASFGVLVWVGSYLGWIPAAGILQPATRHPRRRTAMMITAHLIWGTACGLVVEHFAESEDRKLHRR